MAVSLASPSSVAFNAVNNLRALGRWAFAELTEIYQIDADFKAKVASEFDAMLARTGGVSTKVPT